MSDSDSRTDSDDSSSTPSKKKSKKSPNKGVKDKGKGKGKKSSGKGDELESSIALLVKSNIETSKRVSILTMHYYLQILHKSLVK